MDNQEKVKGVKKIALHKYTLGEELLSSISHGIGGLLAIVAMVLLLIKSDSTADYIAAVLYPLSMLMVYTISSVYHGLVPGNGKRVMRVIDHCDIYFLIVGTYIPYCIITLSDSVGIYVLLAEVIIATIGITFTAIDMKKYGKLAMFCYIGMGWMAILATTYLFKTLGQTGFLLLVLGGVAYTVGAVFYGLGRKLKYVHGVFHICCLLGSVLHFISIYCYVY